MEQNKLVLKNLSEILAALQLEDPNEPGFAGCQQVGPGERRRGGDWSAPGGRVPAGYELPFLQPWDLRQELEQSPGCWHRVARLRNRSN